MKTSGVLRPRPDDFWTTYVDVGKPGCEAHYRAHWKTVDRWVDEVGKDALRKARADEVRARREAKRKPEPASLPRVDTVKVDRNDFQAACQYLRNLTTFVGINERGEYFVNSEILLPSEIVARALAQGMDEWYIERDTMLRLDIERNTDEWVLDRELTE